jgi:hypothetical protein
LFVIFLLAGAGNSKQHHDILSQLRPEEKWQTNKQWTTPWHTQRCSLFICVSFFFWSELAEYVTVLSTVYMFVIFLLAGAGWVCHGVVHCLFVCHFSSG